MSGSSDNPFGFEPVNEFQTANWQEIEFADWFNLYFGSGAAVAVVASGVLFLAGLLLGVVKYSQIRRSDDGRATAWIDRTHRRTLLASFALLLAPVVWKLAAEIAELWPDSNGQARAEITSKVDVVSEASANNLALEGDEVGFLDLLLGLIALTPLLIFLLAVLIGVVRFFQGRRSSDRAAHSYTVIALRAALMYACASLLVAVLSVFSEWPVWLNVACALVLNFFFVAAILSYLYHGLRKDTTNQFVDPVRGTHAFMLLLIGGEVVSFTILLVGFAAAAL